MDWNAWEPIYREILADFGFSQEEDEATAALLSGILGGRRVAQEKIAGMLRGREASVLGNGPNLVEEMDAAEGLLIAADEATSVALEGGLHPAIITTDLDGRVQDQLDCNGGGAIALVLGHGDNRGAVEAWAPLFRGPTMAMTQARPGSGLHNFGGFTDGDRAAFLAHHFGASRIRLLGFDFHNPSPKDSPGEIKLRKLRWAERLVAKLGDSVVLGPD